MLLNTYIVSGGNKGIDTHFLWNFEIYVYGEKLLL